MPMVNGKEYAYTPKGKMAAKKAALGMKSSGKKSPKKQNFSGVASQVYS
jgi:hypothetical protein